MIEAAIFLKDHDDMVDLVAQALEVGAAGRLSPCPGGEARGQQGGGTGGPGRFQKAAAASPENGHAARPGREAYRSLYKTRVCDSSKKGRGKACTGARLQVVG